MPSDIKYQNSVQTSPAPKPRDLDRDLLMQQVESRFQISLTLSVFVPVVVSAFFQTAKATDEMIGSMTQSLSLMVFLLVGCYVIFHLYRSLAISMIALRLINWLLLVNIAYYAIPIWLFMTAKPGPATDGFSKMLLWVSAAGAPIISGLILLAAVSTVVVQIIKWTIVICKWAWGKFKGKTRKPPIEPGK